MVLPSVVAGVLLALSLPPWGWWPLAFVGAGLLYWRLGGLRRRARLLSGWTAGLGCYVVGLWWTGSFNVYGAAVLMGAEALSMGVAALLVPPVRGRIPAFAGAFTLLEYVRMTWPFGGLPIGGVFLGQAGGPLLGTARLGGPLLLTAVVWTGGAGLGALTVALTVALTPMVGSWRRPAAPGSERRVVAPGSERRVVAPGSERRVVDRGCWRRAGAGAGALVVVVALGVGGALAPDGGGAVGHVRVATVQGGGRRGVSDSQVNPATVFQAQLDATALIGREDRGKPPALVLWPEDVIALTGVLAGSPQEATMATLAGSLHATVVAGVTETVSTSAFRNEAVAWGPGGRIVGTYEKVHRVPFGEYVPYRSFFAHLANLSRVPLTAVPGHGDGLLRTPAAPLGVMISYEVFFSNRSRPAVQAGARLLVVPTNTSSYATSQVPTQEVAADRVQAVEEGRDLVQAAPTGYSTVVTHRGAVLQHTVLGHRQVLVGSVALRTGRTVFSYLGDLPMLVLAGLALVAGWLLASAALENREHR
ncbi:MAG: apolipoprotein N-acyltransferase [Acidimicrobiales bacterium]